MQSQPCRSSTDVLPELASVLAELQRIEAGNGIDDELFDTIELIDVILGGLKGESQNE